MAQLQVNGPALRYEIALEIKTGHIVWAYGGFPPGEYPDLKIARKNLLKCFIQASE